MTIGPDPMRRILRMSSRLGISGAPQPGAPLRPSGFGAYGPGRASSSELWGRASRRQLQKAIEQVPRIVGPWPGLGVVLDGGPGDIPKHESLDGAVVEVEVGELSGPELGLPPDRLVALDPRLTPRALDREAVVLRGDLDPPRLQVLDRVVGAAVAKGKLEGVKADRAAEELVAEADPDHWPLADHLPHGLDDVAEGRGITGAVGEKDEFRRSREHLLGGDRAGKQGHPATALPKLVDDAALDAGIDGDHMSARDLAAQLDGRGRGHLPRQIGALHRRLCIDAVARLRLREPRGEDPAAHRPAGADVSHERPGVDAVDRRDAAVAEPVEPAGL